MVFDVLEHKTTVSDTVLFARRLRGVGHVLRIGRRVANATVRGTAMAPDLLPFEGVRDRVLCHISAVQRTYDQRKRTTAAPGGRTTKEAQTLPGLRLLLLGPRRNGVGFHTCFNDLLALFVADVSLTLQIDNQMTG